MKSDSGFYIGTTHEVCEDYALAQEIIGHFHNWNEAPDHIVLISDGCSSSPNTDIGSRIACECAKQSGKQVWDDKRSIIRQAEYLRNLLGLPRRCMDVTLLAANTEDDKIIIKTIGDGNIIVKTKDGNIHVVSMDYARSAPFYLNYVRWWKEEEEWEKIPDNDYTVEYSRIKHNGIIDGEDCYSIETTKSSDCMFTAEHFIPNCNFTLSPKENKLVMKKEDVEWVALSSDGLQSFYEKVTTETSSMNESVWYIDIIIELFQIKNTNGKFVQRRLNKFKKACAKKNWYNADDVSLAILVPGE